MLIPIRLPHTDGESRYLIDPVDIVMVRELQRDEGAVRGCRVFMAPAGDLWLDTTSTLEELEAAIEKARVTP